MLSPMRVNFIALIIHKFGYFRIYTFQWLTSECPRILMGCARRSPRPACFLGGELKARRFLSHSFPEWISGSKLRELVTRIIEGWLWGYGGLLAMSRLRINTFSPSSRAAFHLLCIIYWFIIGRICKVFIGPASHPDGRISGIAFLRRNRLIHSYKFFSWTHKYRQVEGYTTPNGCIFK